MFKYILKRLGLSVLILVAVSILIYGLVRMMPTTFVLKYLPPVHTLEDEQRLLASVGLDKGIIAGYFGWLGNLVDFSNGFPALTLGKTMTGTQGTPVSEIIVTNIPKSFMVAAIATVFEFMIAIPLGITAATHQYSVRDYIVTIFVMVGISMPSFFFGNVFKMIIPNIIPWIPPSGDGKVVNYILPIFTLVILSIGARMRMTRTNMLEVLNSDYIRTARAKGLKEGKVIYKHAFRNTLIPLVTTLAGLLPALFSGAIITEQVFGIGGIGNIALKYTQDGDIPFIMGYNMFLATLSIIGILLADIMYAIVDPRVKLE